MSTSAVHMINTQRRLKALKKTQLINIAVSHSEAGPDWENTRLVWVLMPCIVCVCATDEAGILFSIIVIFQKAKYRYRLNNPVKMFVLVHLCLRVRLVVFSPARQ